MTWQLIGNLSGRDGATVTVADVAPLVTAEIQKAVATLPAEVTRVIESQLATWPRPKDGLNGKDGTTFTGLGFVIDDEAGPIVSLKSTAGDIEARFPGMWDAGVWRAGKHYPRGAGVSWNGSIWIAQVDTKGEKPGDGSGVWRLAVKAGRDAKPPRE